MVYHPGEVQSFYDEEGKIREDVPEPLVKGLMTLLHGVDDHPRPDALTFGALNIWSRRVLTQLEVQPLRDAEIASLAISAWQHLQGDFTINSETE